jgi:aminoglycoside 3-N-acetyltransferase
MRKHEIGAALVPPFFWGEQGGSVSQATRQSLVAQLRELGVASDDVLMVHSSLRRVGPVTGGADSVIDALLEAVAPRGTVLMYADFEPTADVPHFSPERSPCIADNGALCEVFRNRPGTLRSANPGASMLAAGGDAAWFVGDHPMDFGYGPGTPLHRIVLRNGGVLMLGAPLDTVTVLHYAEHIADLPGKRIVRHHYRVEANGQTACVEAEEFDTGRPAVDGMPENYFEQIVRAFIRDAGIRPGRFGAAEAWLLPASALVAFAVDRMEREFGSR